MSKVVVESSIEVAATPARVWPLLCDARLPLTAPCCFRIGVPTPKTCRIVGEASGVGSTRQSHTNRGVINQAITEWAPPSRLAFEARSDSIGLHCHITAMTDTFTIEAAPSGARLSRRTEFETHGMMAGAKACLFRATVRHIQRYVMRSFKALAEAAQPV